MQIMHSEPNYVISHLRIIPEAPNKVIRRVVIRRVDTLCLFCFVAGVGGGGGKTASRKKCDLQKKPSLLYILFNYILNFKM